MDSLALAGVDVIVEFDVEANDEKVGERERKLSHGGVGEGGLPRGEKLAALLLSKGTAGCFNFKCLLKFPKDPPAVLRRVLQYLHSALCASLGLKWYHISLFFALEDISALDTIMR